MGDELDWPLRGWEAVEAGMLSVRELRRFYLPVYPGVHVPRGAELSAVQRSRAAWLWARRRGVIAGLSAAAMLGAKWIEPGLPAELIHTNRRQPGMLIVHSDDVAIDETQRVDGMTVTAAARIAFDIGRRLEIEIDVQRVDALLNATDVKVSDIESVAASHPGVRGLTRLRRTLELVDGGAESPYEGVAYESAQSPDLGREENQAQLAWPSRTNNELTEPWSSSTVMATKRWSRHAPSTSR